MTVLALNFVLASVDIVAKEDRLAGSAQATSVGGGDDGSGDGVSTGQGLLRERRLSTEGNEDGDASGRNATDDECHLTDHHLTDEEEP